MDMEGTLHRMVPRSLPKQMLKRQSEAGAGGDISDPNSWKRKVLLSRQDCTLITRPGLTNQHTLTLTPMPCMQMSVQLAEEWQSFSEHVIQEFVYDTFWAALTPDSQFPMLGRSLLNQAFAALLARARQLPLHQCSLEVVNSLVVRSHPTLQKHTNTTVTRFFAAAEWWLRTFRKSDQSWSCTRAVV